MLASWKVAGLGGVRSMSMLPVLLSRRLAVANLMRHEQMKGYTEKKPFRLAEELRYL